MQHDIYVCMYDYKINHVFVWEDITMLVFICLRESPTKESSWHLTRGNKGVYAGISG